MAQGRRRPRTRQTLDEKHAYCASGPAFVSVRSTSANASANLSKSPPNDITICLLFSTSEG